MAETARTDMTLVDVMGQDTPINVAKEAAQAMGLTLEQLYTTRLGSIESSQVRALCVTLDRRADEVLGLACPALADPERGRDDGRALLDYERAMDALLDVAWGTAHLLAAMGAAAEDEGSDATALAILEDALSAAAQDATRAKQAFRAARA